MRGLWGRFRALSAPAKIVLALLALGVGVVLSPLMVLLAAIALAGCLLVLLLSVTTRRIPSRTWGLATLASFAALLAFSGASVALYGGSQPETTPAPEAAEKDPVEPREEPKPAETTAEEEGKPEPTREEVAAVEPAPEPAPEPEPEPKREPEPAPSPARHQLQLQHRPSPPTTRPRRSRGWWTATPSRSRRRSTALTMSGS